VSTTPGETLTHPRPAAPPEAPAVPARVRGLVVLVWVVLLAHLVATFIWAAPGHLTGRPSGESTGDVPTRAVHRALEPYMTPVFAQNWSVFAPSPLHVEYSLRVRGVYAGGPDGDLVPEPWIDATAVEVRALAGHVLPAATERPARRLAAELRTAYLDLPDPGREVLLVSPAAEPDAGPGPWRGLRTALLDAGGTPADVDRYLDRDRAVTAYATQVVRASRSAPAPGADGPDNPAADPAPSDLVYVQVSILRRPVAPSGTDERPAADELVLGARPAGVVPGQDDAAFRATWDALRGAPDPTGLPDGGPAR